MIEADFEREYRMNLVETLPSISWRRFLVLLNGLSNNSTFVRTIVVRNQRKNKGEEVIEDPVEAEKAFEKVWA